MYIIYLVVIFLRWLATRLFPVLLLSSPSESPWEIQHNSEFFGELLKSIIGKIKSIIDSENLGTRQLVMNKREGKQKLPLRREGPYALALITMQGNN